MDKDMARKKSRKSRENPCSNRSTMHTYRHDTNPRPVQGAENSIMSQKEWKESCQGHIGYVVGWCKNSHFLTLWVGAWCPRANLLTLCISVLSPDIVVQQKPSAERQWGCSKADQSLWKGASRLQPLSLPVGCSRDNTLISLCLAGHSLFPLTPPHKTTHVLN